MKTPGKEAEEKWTPGREVEDNCIGREVEDKLHMPRKLSQIPTDYHCLRAGLNYNPCSTLQPLKP